MNKFNILKSANKIQLVLFLLIVLSMTSLSNTERNKKLIDTLKKEKFDEKSKLESILNTGRMKGIIDRPIYEVIEDGETGLGKVQLTLNKENRLLAKITYTIDLQDSFIGIEEILLEDEEPLPIDCHDTILERLKKGRKELFGSEDLEELLDKAGFDKRELNIAKNSNVNKFIKFSEMLDEDELEREIGEEISLKELNRAPWKYVGKLIHLPKVEVVEVSTNAPGSSAAKRFSSDKPLIEMQVVDYQGNTVFLVNIGDKEIYKGSKISASGVVVGIIKLKNVMGSEFELPIIITKEESEGNQPIKENQMIIMGENEDHKFIKESQINHSLNKDIKVTWEEFKIGLGKDKQWEWRASKYEGKDCLDLIISHQDRITLYLNKEKNKVEILNMVTGGEQLPRLFGYEMYMDRLVAAYVGMYGMKQLGVTD